MNHLDSNPCQQQNTNEYMKTLMNKLNAEENKLEQENNHGEYEKCV